jgi:hypothetical protein
MTGPRPPADTDAPDTTGPDTDPVVTVAGSTAMRSAT